MCFTAGIIPQLCEVFDKKKTFLKLGVALRMSPTSQPQTRAGKTMAQMARICPRAGAGIR
jgi:hypothetical protein